MNWVVFLAVLVGGPLVAAAGLALASVVARGIARVTDDEQVGFAIIFGLFIVAMATMVGLVL